VALFNIKELSTEKLTDTDSSGAGQNPQLKAAAEIIKKINPDILVINEIDHDYSGFADDLTINAKRFQKAYLARGENGIMYTQQFATFCNTGIPSGFDLDNNDLTATALHRGSRDYGGDCFGYGTYPGQYSMGILSKLPIDTNEIRTFQKFLWQDLPGHHIPPDYYSKEELDVFRLSSKSHWDIPIYVNGDKIHLLLSHPTPPVFDGDEDRNGRRNFDEIKFWVHYLADDQALYDDNGVKGGFAGGAPFIIVGDLNASPQSDINYDNQIAINQLLKHPDIQDTGKWLIGSGGLGGEEPGPPDYIEQHTAAFGRNFRTRIDYILPSKNIKIIDGGIFWPAFEEDPDGYKLAEEASDHRLVWLDITLPK
jgi:endonuclease/exonuclease/phosphatase family metal-dependent hydrolase